MVKENSVMCIEVYGEFFPSKPGLCRAGCNGSAVGALMRIYQPNGPAMTALCDQLRMMSTTLQVPEAWPERQLKACGHAGVFDWFIPKEMGGMGWRESENLTWLYRYFRGLFDHGLCLDSAGGCHTSNLLESARRPCERSGCLSTSRDRFFLSIAVSQITTSGRHFRFINDGKTNG